MSSNHKIDKLCCIIVAIMLLITELFTYGEALGIQTTASAKSRYAQTLFDTQKVHTIDIVMEDWDAFIAECENEEYVACTVVIDGERYPNVAIRAKGNTSLSSVKSMDSERYSFKIEFDHYDNAGSYYGLDKLCLNNIIQDNTYMKDYLTYRMMAEFGVAAPLCSYAYLTVNGADFGLYLAVEAVEDSFLTRNYSGEDGELYKPDSMDMGGGRGNGMDFDMSEWEQNRGQDANTSGKDNVVPNTSGGFGGGRGDFGNMPQLSDEGGFDFSQNGMPDFSGDGENNRQNFGGFGGMGGFGGIGGNDVSLIYSDDAYDSYQNIFDNAKTDLSNADKDRLIAALKDLNENQNIPQTVDTEAVIRYFVVHNFVVNFDSYTGSMIHNYYLYENDGQLSMIPWDYNLAFGGFMSSSDATSLVNYPIDDPISGGSVESRPMIAWIFADEGYTTQYHELFAQFLNEVDILGIIRSTADLIAPYVERDPTAFCSYAEFNDGVKALEQFCDLRIQSVKGQLDGSIGASNEAQQQNENRIDAGDLKLSDMGSMGNMGGGRGDFNQSRTDQPENNGQQTKVLGSNQMPAVKTGMPFGNGEMPEGFDPSTMQPPDDFGQDGMQAPEKTDQSAAQMPGGERPDMTGQGSGMQGVIFEILILLICILLLGFGILFAARYQPRKEG